MTKHDKGQNPNDIKADKWNPLAAIVNVSTGHPWKTLGIFIIITIFFMIPASQLTMDSSWDQVFGDDMPDEVKDYQDMIDEFGEQEPVVIVVDCSDSEPETAELFLGDLANELNNIDDFKDVRYKQDIDFAGDKTILYLPSDTISFILANDTVEVVEGRYNAVMNAMNQPRYFVSEDGQIYLLDMVVNITIDSSEQRTEIFDGLYDLLDDVQDSNATYKDLEVGLTGGFMIMDYEGDEMAMSDMAITMIITFVLILIILFMSFRSFSLPVLALVPLLVGIVITAGLIYIMFGALNMIAAVFAVLLLGLGIAFSIHILTRFNEEMQGNSNMRKAFQKTSVNTGKAVVMGAITTAIAFGALAFSKTQAMYQMGIILSIGLVITMVCVLFILPALVTLRLRRGKLKQNMQKSARYEVLGKIGYGTSKYATIFVAFFILIGVFIAIQAPTAEMEDDMTQLQPTTLPAYKTMEKVKDNFNYTEDYLLSVADSYDKLVESVESFRTHPEVMQVESILDFLPQNQSDKISIIDQSRTSNPDRANISWLNIDEMTWEELPESIKQNWVVESEDGENVKFLIKIKAWGNIWEEDYRNDLVEDLEEINPTIVGGVIMWNKLLTVLSEDIIWVTVYATIPIFIVAYIGFRKRNPIYSLLVLLPIAGGVGGILALSEILSISLNVVSIMMIPLVIGIGIDDGIHILHRYSEEGFGSIPKVVQNTGKAIFLTTATTTLAFSSFLVAEHPGLHALGQVPVVGLILAFIASIVFLPALIRLTLDRSKVARAAHSIQAAKQPSG
ncbi:MAG: RND family transporter [Candidatus Thorarchaeota archaeon]